MVTHQNDCKLLLCRRMSPGGLSLSQISAKLAVSQLSPYSCPRRQPPVKHHIQNSTTAVCTRPCVHCSTRKQSSVYGCSRSRNQPTAQVHGCTCNLYTLLQTWVSRNSGRCYSFSSARSSKIKIRTFRTYTTSRIRIQSHPCTLYFANITTAKYCLASFLNTEWW